MGNRGLLLLLLVASVALSAPAFGQTLEVPASWGGVWEVDGVDKDCDTGQTIFEYSDTDTVCGGMSLAPDEGIDMGCTGTANDTMLDGVCSGFVNVGGCTITLTYTFQIERTGDSLVGNERWTWSYVGDCGGQEDECEDSEFTATRVAPEPGSCETTPVESATWGMIKAVYR